MLSKRTLLSGMAGLAMAGAAIAQSAAPASAHDWDHHGYYRHGWHHHHDYGGAIGAGILGLAAGAVIGGALTPREVYYDDYYAPPPVYYYRSAPAYAYDPPVVTYRLGYGHVARCEARYRTYDPRTDTFMGYDGRPHYCRL